MNTATKKPLTTCESYASVSDISGQTEVIQIAVWSGVDTVWLNM